MTKSTRTDDLDLPVVTLSDGEFFDAYADMMLPEDIVAMLDRRCWQETLVGIYQLLDRRFRDRSRVVGPCAAGPS